MDMLQSEYIIVSYCWPKSAKSVQKMKKKSKNLIFFHKTNTKYHICMNCANIGGPPDNSGRLQRPKFSAPLCRVGLTILS